MAESKSKGQAATDSKLISQHKKLAMGEKVTGMKKGGMCAKKGGIAKKGK